MQILDTGGVWRDHEILDVKPTAFDRAKRLSKTQRARVMRNGIESTRAFRAPHQ